MVQSESTDTNRNSSPHALKREQRKGVGPGLALRVPGMAISAKSTPRSVGLDAGFAEQHLLASAVFSSTRRGTTEHRFQATRRMGQSQPV
jgi:hypothetical protein